MFSSKLNVITTFLFLLHISTSTAYEVINTFKDKINAGEVKYYSLESQTPIVLALYSTEGDADMYASPTNKNSKPSADSFEYMSASCGFDVMVVPMSEAVRRVSVGIFGHVRHERTQYQVWVVEPEKEDVLRYQVWELDPDVMREQLVIDIDPLVMSNDPTLHILLDSLHTNVGVTGTSSVSTGVSKALRKLLEWTGFVLLKLLEVGVEILV